MSFRQSVPLPKTYRLLNHGPTVLVTSAHNGRRNVMAPAWNMALNFEPAQVAVVIDKSTVTRELVEASGKFALNVPARGIASHVLAVGRTSARELDANIHEDKFAAYGLQTFLGNDPELPHVEGCVAWLECKVIPEPHIQKTYDLFRQFIEFRRESLSGEAKIGKQPECTNVHEDCETIFNDASQARSRKSMSCRAKSPLRG